MESNVIEQGEWNYDSGNIIWHLTKEGMLSISGSGIIELSIVDYKINAGEGWDGHYSTEYNEWPWIHLKDKIKHIIINEGIVGIGNNCFCNCYNLTSIDLPKSLRFIDSNVCSHTGLNKINLPEGLERIGLAFVDTPLRAEKEEVYIDKWLIKANVKRQKYYVRQNIKGIATGALSGCEIEELYIPGSVKYIYDSDEVNFKRIYLGRGCPMIFWKNRSKFPEETKNPEIVRTKGIDPSVDYEPQWSCYKFPLTEDTYDRAKSSKEKRIIVPFLEKVKIKAFQEAHCHCSMHITSKGRMSPKQYDNCSNERKEFDVYNLSRIGLNEIESDKDKIVVRLHPVMAVANCTILSILNHLEKMKNNMANDIKYKLEIYVPKDIKKEYIIFRKIVTRLFGWIEKCKIIVTNEKTHYDASYKALPTKLLLKKKILKNLKI